MAFQKMQLYMVTFALPDGDHIIAGYSSGKIDEAVEHYRRIVMQNPEATFDPARVVPATIDQIDAATQALRNADPGRPLATDLGLDSPNRILTNPEVVPGSTFTPPGSGDDDASDE